MKQWLALVCDKSTGLPTGSSATWQLIGEINGINHYAIARHDEGHIKYFGHSFGYIEGDILRLFRADAEETPWSFGNMSDGTQYSVVNLKTLRYETWVISNRGKVSLQYTGIIIEGGTDGP